MGIVLSTVLRQPRQNHYTGFSRNQVQYRLWHKGIFRIYWKGDPAAVGITCTAIIYVKGEDDL